VISCTPSNPKAGDMSEVFPCTGNRVRYPRFRPGHDRNQLGDGAELPSRRDGPRSPGRLWNAAFAASLAAFPGWRAQTNVGLISLRRRKMQRIPNLRKISGRCEFRRLPRQGAHPSRPELVFVNSIASSAEAVTPATSKLASQSALPISSATRKSSFTINMRAGV
jgi:hypothetical protein